MIALGRLRGLGQARSLTPAEEQRSVRHVLSAPRWTPSGKPPNQASGYVPKGREHYLTWPEKFASEGRSLRGCCGPAPSPLAGLGLLGALLFL